MAAKVNFKRELTGFYMVGTGRAEESCTLGRHDALRELRSPGSVGA